MYIKRLEIAGFKSFTERTAVPFSPGISAVVGPNGCGKSNIIDAIRWVMGEQSPKLLRARNMEDLLFNGSQGRAPAALAEVTLTMSREMDAGQGQAEVAVTRRLYRYGDSEYLINRVPSRLKDVLRFFIEAGMGTRAYGIIEQERVGRLVDARPDERRLLLDEAAGITRYKEQKKDSERKIEAAQQNLVSVAALMAETKKQLSVISRAAARASRYQATRDELRELEIILSARRFLVLSAQSSGLTVEMASLRDGLTAQIARASQVELELDRLKFEQNAAEHTLEEELSAWHKLVAVHNQLQKESEHVESTLASAGERIQKAREEIEELDRDRVRRGEELAKLAEEKMTLAAEHGRAEELRLVLGEKWKTLKADSDRLAKKRDDVADEHDVVKERLQHLAETLAGSDSLMEHLLDRKKSLELEKNQSGQSLEEASERIQSLLRFQKNLEEDHQEAEQSVLAGREQSQMDRVVLENLVRELGQAESRMAGLSARLETLEDLKAGFGWYPDGVKALLLAPELRSDGLLGPLAEALEIPAGYETAAEAVLGERLAWILVEDRPAGLKALKYARDHQLGRCGFVSRKEISGDLTPALLGDFKLAGGEEELDPQSVWLTREGEYLGRIFMASGSSGKKSENTGLLARLREVETAEKEVGETEEVLGAIKLKIEAARQELRVAEEALAVAESNKNRLAGDLAEASSRIMVARSEENGLRIRRDSLSTEVERTTAEFKACEEKRELAASEREKLLERAEEVESVLLEAEEAVGERTGELEDLKEQEREAATAAEHTGERLQGVSRELGRLTDWLDSLESRREDLVHTEMATVKEIEKLTARKAELVSSLAEGPDQLALAERKVTELKEARLGGREQVVAMEDEARQARRQREEMVGRLNVLERDLLEASYSLRQLEENLLKDWRIVLKGSTATIEAEGEIWDESQEPEAVQGADSVDTGVTGEDPDSETPETAGADNGSMVEKSGVTPPQEIKPQEWADRELPEGAEELVLQLKEKIAAMGEISLAAIEEEAVLSERYNFYRTQYDDLVKALDDLKDGIARINQTCRRRFTETFNEADLKFREIFPVLFEGGEGWLGLSNEDDPLESGVEIHVHPPGKKIMVMSLLSGGEKALTALALIFALYLIKPSPFCLLDEADAPLDEANIDRFNRLLERLSESSQIIMVTHNKRTMQISRTLYGVTMEIPGVSRLVGVNLAEAEGLTDV